MRGYDQYPKAIRDDFEKAFKFVQRWEGGYVNRKEDYGGPTNRGVTQRTYDAYRKRKGLRTRTVKDITEHEVRSIYWTYYEPFLSWGFNGPQMAVVFNIAVNAGHARAKQLVRLTNQEGARLRVKVTHRTEPKTWNILLIGQLRAYYNRVFALDPTQGVFIKGWLNRTNALQEFILNYDKAK